jgi:hypothetical protein
MKKIMMRAITGMLAAGAVFPAAAAKNASQTASAAATCTGMKLECLASVDRGATASQGHVRFYKRHSSCRYFGGSTPAPDSYCEVLCNSTWEQCVKTGFWEGRFIHRPAERR